MLARRTSPGLTILAAWTASLAMAALASTASAAPVTIPTSTADALQGAGQGLCVAYAVSTNPLGDFPPATATDTQNVGGFITGLNAFMETNLATRVQYVQQTIFDLSNNQDTGTLKTSWGDFTNSMLPQCLIGGCNFFMNDTTTSFGGRFRGFLNVTSAIADKPIHIGFYADDAVALTFFDKSGNAYPVMGQAPYEGFPTWRLTEQVTFAQTGLYPLEIVYAQIGDSAALEMSYFLGDFTDIHISANQMSDAGANTSLDAAGFTLFPVTDFFQTLSGEPSFPDVAVCQQCNREFVGQFGNNGCPAAYFCNPAALCAPCDTEIFCGPTCSPCGGMTPFCINDNAKIACGQCRSDADCQKGFSCDPTTHVCNQCNTDSDCSQGMECVAHVCQWCAEQNKCAGNSCNCCPVGANGKPMQCTTLPGEKTADGGVSASTAPECVECLDSSDCAEGGVCDVTIGQCVPALPANESTMCCGPNCLACPADDPLCLPGPYGTACAACRNDMECPTGNFCIQGQCSPCTHDRHCGTRCETCSGDTPFCNTAQIVSEAACVRCTEDSECVGGKCDPTTHACTSSCAMSCAPETPYCDGEACVACYADTQCPCGGTCDMSSHTCSTSCKTNGDCLGDQHCHYASNGSAEVCSPGPLPDDADCGSTLANICSGNNSIGARGANPTPASGIVALSVLGLWLRRRQSRRHPPTQTPRTPRPSRAKQAHPHREGQP